MQILSEQEIISLLERQIPFSAQPPHQGYVIKVDRYVPAVATAIHDGHRIQARFADALAVDESERLFEEDPFTGEMADRLAISLRALDSRYNYDLNRTPKTCIYDHAWGKMVWKGSLSEAERNTILAYHASYYRVLAALLRSLNERFGSSVVYDLHSYNYQRIGEQSPLFNIGTYHIDQSRYGDEAKHLSDQFQNIAEDYDDRAVCDEVFFGKGYQAQFIGRHVPASLCLPIEVKKIFMDGAGLLLNDTVFRELLGGIQRALIDSASKFAKRFTTVELEPDAFLADRIQAEASHDPH